jgi:hypothetical protein
VGGYGFLFRSEFFFRTTQELECLFFLSRKARILFPEFNIRLYDKNSESDFCFPPPKSEYFFQQHWESEYFFRKKPYPPPPFQVKWSFLNSLMMCALRRSNYTSVLVFVLTQPDLKLTIYPT